MSNSGKATRVGALLVALGTSACCWLPLLLVGLGVGATGAGAVFESIRPYLMAATVVLLGAAFYFTYRRPKTACDADGACVTPGTGGRTKAMLWGITAIAVVSFAFPYWSHSRLEDVNADVASLGAPAFEIPVDGMTCAACAVSVHGAVTSVPGVRAAKVEESPGSVRVWTEGQVDPNAVIEAIARVGYTPGVAVLKKSSAPSSTSTVYVEIKGMVQQLGIT